MEKILERLEEIDDDEYLRYLATWLVDNENSFLRYSPSQGADVIVYDLLYEELICFKKSLL